MCFGHYPSSCLCLTCPVSLTKHIVSETGFRFRLQVKPTQLGPIDRASLYLHTKIETSFIDWTQLNRFYLKTETESSFRNVVF
jgi:hypothetical protein